MNDDFIYDAELKRNVFVGDLEKLKASFIWDKPPDDLDIATYTVAGRGFVWHELKRAELHLLRAAFAADTFEDFERHMASAQKTRWAARYALPVDDYFHPDAEAARQKTILEKMRR
jgi:hypothetical protein